MVIHSFNPFLCAMGDENIANKRRAHERDDDIEAECVEDVVEVESEGEYLIHAAMRGLCGLTNFHCQSVERPYKVVRRRIRICTGYHVSPKCSLNMILNENKSSYIACHHESS